MDKIGIKCYRFVQNITLSINTRIPRWKAPDVFCLGIKQWVILATCPHREHHLHIEAWWWWHHIVGMRCRDSQQGLGNWSDLRARWTEPNTGQSWKTNPFQLAWYLRLGQFNFQQDIDSILPNIHRRCSKPSYWLCRLRIYGKACTNDQDSERKRSKLF